MGLPSDDQGHGRRCAVACACACQAQTSSTLLFQAAQGERKQLGNPGALHREIHSDRPRHIEIQVLADRHAM